MTCRSASPAAALALLLALSDPAVAQEQAPVRVQLHVGGDPQLRARASACLRAALQPSPRLAITERDAEYVLSLVVLPIGAAGFAVSATALSAHTDASLAALARRWGLDDDEAERLRLTFRGNGALLDQRVLTGPDIEALCRDVATAFTTDTLATLVPPR